MSTVPPIIDRERLRQERHSYIVGSVSVLVVVILAISALNLLLFHGQLPRTLDDAEREFQQLQAHLTWQQYFSMQLIYWAGGAALFFLNFRFSLLARRPRGVFARSRPSARALWWVVLFMNSLFYTLIVPQLLITWLLARWGNDAIAQLGPGPGVQAGSAGGNGER